MCGDRRHWERALQVNETEHHDPKLSTEAELVALSDSANQELFLRNFLHHQGYDMGPVILYQDNMSTMGLVARGRSGAEKTRHILIRYYWVSEQVANGTAIVEHKGTKDMYANLSD
jgi:hypothetical protein